MCYTVNLCQTPRYISEMLHSITLGFKGDFSAVDYMAHMNSIILHILYIC